MTELLYHTDAYLKEFDANLIAVEGNVIALDRTAFYPSGGGQPHDVGTLTVGDITYAVAKVRKAGTEVWHELSGDLAGFQNGVVVRGTVDWTRRH